MHDAKVIWTLAPNWRSYISEGKLQQETGNAVTELNCQFRVVKHSPTPETNNKLAWHHICLTISPSSTRHQHSRVAGNNSEDEQYACIRENDHNRTTHWSTVQVSVNVSLYQVGIQSEDTRIRSLSEGNPSMYYDKRKERIFHITDIDATHIILQLPDQTKRKMRLQICIFFILHKWFLIPSPRTHKPR
jgi:hypothetical protein